MTVTAMPPGTSRDSTPAPGIVTGLVDLATWYAVHPSAPLVTPLLNIPVPAGAPGARITALEEIAEQLGVEVAERDGTLIAERQFGGITIEAHLSHPDASVSGYLARSASAREAARAGRGAAA
jgi:hypothetical protein